MTTQQAKQKPSAQGANAQEKTAELKISKPAEKKALTAEERAEKIGFLAKGKIKRDQLKKLLTK